MEAFFTALFQTRVRRALAILGVLSISALTLVVLPPFQFPPEARISIPRGVSVREAAVLLHDADLVRSPLFFTLLIQMFGADRGVSHGVYHFERALSVFEVAYRVNRGLTGAALVRVTVPEGATTRDIADILETALPEFDHERFRELSRAHEGYLYPETYFFAEDVTPEEVVRTMRTEFERAVGELELLRAREGRALSDVVIMASLLEKEARLYETKQIVAGILWKRLELDMPLQVDAVFGYIFETDTFNPSFSQLEVDSPYNTYTNRGLPPGPIANPGIESLRAALSPIETEYLFYLTGSDGTMHYAATFEDHVKNRQFLR